MPNTSVPERSPAPKPARITCLNALEDAGQLPVPEGDVVARDPRRSPGASRISRTSVHEREARQQTWSASRGRRISRPARPVDHQQPEVGGGSPSVQISQSITAATSRRRRASCCRAGSRHGRCRRSWAGTALTPALVDYVDISRAIDPVELGLVELSMPPLELARGCSPRDVRGRRARHRPSRPRGDRPARPRATPVHWRGHLRPGLRRRPRSIPQDVAGRPTPSHRTGRP